jgi:hypothetical protein
LRGKLGLNLALEEANLMGEKLDSVEVGKIKTNPSLLGALVKQVLG